MPAFPTLPSSPARQGFFEEEEVMAVVGALDAPENDLVLALWLLGWRKREVQFLKWADVDMRGGETTSGPHEHGASLVRASRRR